MTGASVRDRHRRQVYVAEELAAENTVLDNHHDAHWLAALVGDVVVSPWWAAAGGHDRVDVVVNRSAQRSYWDPQRRRLSLSPRATTVATVTHELAHALVTDTGPMWRSPHGSEFRGAHVLIRRLVLGYRCAMDLAEVYRQFGLAVDTTPWVPQEVPARSILDSSWYDGLTIVGRPRTTSIRSPVGHRPIAL